MAAYAALVSLMNTMQQIMNHPRLSTSLDKNQIESLQEKAGFFLKFIESYHSHGGRKEAEDLESQIASAAHAAEDVIESHVADQILAGSTSARSNSSTFGLDLWKEIQDMGAIRAKLVKFQKKWRSKDQNSTYSTDLLCGPQSVMQGMASIKKKVTKFKEIMGFKSQQPSYSAVVASSRSPTTGKTTMVGFDDYLIQLMDLLTGQQSNRQVIPIVGMGGIGKTTLARNAFENSLIVQFFDIRAWVTVSQEYSVRGILLSLLSSLEKGGSFMALDQHQLGEQLYKHLWGRRYLIILDDLWGIEAWDDIKFSFPDNDNGSRIALTTRLTDVATPFRSSYLKINFLGEDQSWNLFCEKAFGEEGCPTELEKAGKRIAKNCKGLPLSIVVIGGLLRNSLKSQEYWENVAKDTNPVLNSEGEEQCLNMLSLSYNHLPPHLKSCFLCMGFFPEDHEIRVSQLIKLWIAEGFLKQNEAQSLEEAAEGYLKDLIDRNLILVSIWGSNGKIKACSIHDLLRALCLRVAKKEKFLCVVKLLDTPKPIDRERRIVIHDSIQRESSWHEVFRASESAVLARSLICKGHPLFKFRLLRIFMSTVGENFDRGLVEADFQYVNLRCLDRRPVWFHHDLISSIGSYESQYLIPREITLFWNLQTLRIKGCRARIVAPYEIWEMTQLRHVEVDTLYLPDPPQGDTVDQQVNSVLQNLQTLSRAHNFRLSEEVCKRIPNIKKLRTMYNELPEECEASSYYSPQNLGQFHKLESLNSYFSETVNWRDMVLNMAFPSSIKKLSLYGCRLYWEDLSIIGSLPQLEVLKLECNSAIGGEWNPVEREFPRLKFLKIWSCDLTNWNADSFHFPVLEILVLRCLTRFHKIPSGIGEIPTLRSIHLHSCSWACINSAMEILAEQESLGNEDLQLEVLFNPVGKEALKRFRKKVEKEGFTGKNLKYGYW